MGLIRLAALSAIGLIGYKFYEKSQSEQRVAPVGAKTGKGKSPDARPNVRDAGPDAMADKPKRKWTKVDQQSDESFPASDPPANY